MRGLVFLYGAPASGKTTLGRRLASALGCPFVDLDEEVVRQSGRTIPEIFASDGEPSFRALESAALTRLDVPTGVVALGGGTLLRPENRAFCERAGTVICLDAPSDAERARRLGVAAVGARPLGDKAKERAAHYAAFPNRVVGWFDLGDSLVLCGSGLASAFLSGLPVVADATAASLWAERLGVVPVATIPSGERHKTIGTVASLWGAFARAGLGRRDTVAALGGGVTGDLTGFAAATWMRGIGWINVPTTLLAMVDASTGGKTGCDLPEGKNLAGAFHSPKLVVVDAGFLATLPEETLRDGKAEMIKHEIIGGRTGNGERGTESGSDGARDFRESRGQGRHCARRPVRDERAAASAQLRPHGRARDREGDGLRGLAWRGRGDRLRRGGEDRGAARPGVRRLAGRAGRRFRRRRAADEDRSGKVEVDERGSGEARALDEG